MFTRNATKNTVTARDVFYISMMVIEYFHKCGYTFLLGVVFVILFVIQAFSLCNLFNSLDPTQTVSVHRSGWCRFIIAHLFSKLLYSCVCVCVSGGALTQTLDRAMVGWIEDSSDTTLVEDPDRMQMEGREEVTDMSPLGGSSLYLRNRTGLNLLIVMRGWNSEYMSTWEHLIVLLRL